MNRPLSSIFVAINQIFQLDCIKTGDFDENHFFVSASDDGVAVKYR
jgi:hypothetical protein